MVYKNMSVLEIFNSAMILLAHLIVLLYFIQRFFRAMILHYKLVAEITEFNINVEQSRSSLDYTAAKITETLKQIDPDIDTELSINHNLTIFKSKMKKLMEKYSKTEEKIIELLRSEDNTDNKMTGTPVDINLEVERLLSKKKSKKLLSLSHQSMESKVSMEAG